MKKQISAIIAIACFSLATIPAAMAKHDHQGQRGELRIFKGLDLSSQQKQDIKTLMKHTRSDNSVFAAERETFRAQLDVLMSMPTWDATLASQLIKQQMVSKQQVQLNKVKSKHAAFLLLSDEQQAELLEKMADKKDRKAKKDKKGKKDKKRGKNKRMAKRLDLSDEQKEAIKAIKAASKAQFELVRADMKNYKDAEDALVLSESFDEAAWISLNDSHADTFMTAQLAKMKAKYDEYNVLSAEQKLKLAEMREKMKEKMKEKREKAGSV